MPGGGIPPLLYLLYFFDKDRKRKKKDQDQGMSPPNKATPATYAQLRRRFEGP